MRWIVFILLLAICLTLDQAFLQVIAIGSIFPGTCGALVVFVALFAPRPTALWAALLAGTMLDLGSPAVDAQGHPYYVIGPYALGFVLGAYLVLLLRSIVFRRNPLTVGMLTLPFLLAVSVIFLAIWSIRGFYADAQLPWHSESVTSQIAQMIGWATYSALLALPLGWLLLITWSLWGFDQLPARPSRR
ncbi:MAG: hypothetical protein MK085_13800 [Phycisphaerales bacterium]|nr:hypothetical protein [Phycisphaerales bacterium]